MVIVHSISCPIAYVIAFLASTEYWQLILVPSTIVVASTSLCFHGGLHLIAIDDFWKRTVPMASVEEGRLAQHHGLLRIPNYATTLRDDRPWPGGIILYTNALWGCCIIVSVLRTLARRGDRHHGIYAPGVVTSFSQAKLQWIKSLNFELKQMKSCLAKGHGDDIMIKTLLSPWCAVPVVCFEMRPDQYIRNPSL